MMKRTPNYLAADPIETLLRQLADQLLEEVAVRLAQNPDMVDRLLAPLEERLRLKHPEPAYLKVKDYAKRRSVCTRTVENWIVDGLPMTGKGRQRRVPVAKADKWLDERHVEDEVAELGRRNARKSMKRGKP